MVRFNWNKLFRACKGDLNKYKETFNFILTRDPLVYKKYMRQVITADKQSFILSPLSMLNSRQGTDIDKLVYLHLASMRSLADYTLHDVLYLPGYLAYKYDYDKLVLNKLITVHNDRIILNFENK